MKTFRWGDSSSCGISNKCVYSVWNGWIDISSFSSFWVTISSSCLVYGASQRVFEHDRRVSWISSEISASVLTGFFKTSIDLINLSNLEGLAEVLFLNLQLSSVFIFSALHFSKKFIDSNKAHGFLFEAFFLLLKSSVTFLFHSLNCLTGWRID